MRLRNKIMYGAGDMGVSIVYFAVGIFFIFYLTEYVKMSPYLAGLAFFIGKLWDGVNDPFMGWISDKTNSKYGRKRVYLLFGAIPFGLSFTTLWMIPLQASITTQFILAVLTMVFFGTMYTVVVVPYMALVPVLSDDYDERTQITGIRAILSTIGTIFGGGIALVVSGLSDIRGMGYIFGGYAALMIYISAQGVKDIEQQEKNQHAIDTGTFNQYFQMMKERNVFLLLKMKFLGAIGTGLLSASIPYYAKHILGDESFSTYGLAVYIIFSAISIPLWNKLSHRKDKRDLLLFSNFLVLLVLLSIGFFVDANSIPLFFLGSALLGITMASYLLFPYSLVPDLVEYYEFKSGERHESIFFGFWMTVHQLGIAFSGLILGFFLEFGGYNVNATSQSSNAIITIKSAFGFLPGFFLVVAALSLRKYEINREFFNSIKSSLQEM